MRMQDPDNPVDSLAMILLTFILSDIFLRLFFLTRSLNGV